MNHLLIIHTIRCLGESVDTERFLQEKP